MPASVRARVVPKEKRPRLNGRFFYNVISVGYEQDFYDLNDLSAAGAYIIGTVQ